MLGWCWTLQEFLFQVFSMGFPQFSLTQCPPLIPSVPQEQGEFLIPFPIPFQAYCRWNSNGNSAPLDGRIPALETLEGIPRFPEGWEKRQQHPGNLRNSRETQGKIFPMETQLHLPVEFSALEIWKFPDFPPLRKLFQNSLIPTCTIP